MENCYENKCSCGRVYYGDKLQPFCASCYDIKLRTAEQERDQYKEQLDRPRIALLKELESLRAKIKEAQEQSPVAYVHLAPDEFSKDYDVRFWRKAAIGTKLYAAPVIPD